jgi:prophage antirepressor-like protein
MSRGPEGMGVLPVGLAAPRPGERGYKAEADKADALQIFSFEAHEVRTVEIDGATWWVGKDVCEVLGYKDTVNAIKQHCRGVVKHHPIVDSLGRNQEVRIIAEPDLFRLIAGSRLPEANRFEAWIYEEVLPSIRRTGSYHGYDIPQSLPEALRLAAEAIEERNQLQDMTDRLTFQIAALEPKAKVYDRIASAGDDRLLSEIGKVTGLGPHNIFTTLYREHVIFRNSSGEWVPYQTYVYRGYFRVIETPYTDRAGEEHLNHRTYVTGKGEAWIAEKFFPKPSAAAIEAQR